MPGTTKFAFLPEEKVPGEDSKKKHLAMQESPGALFPQPQASRFNEQWEKLPDIGFKRTNVTG